MSGTALSRLEALRQDVRVPVLDFSNRVTYRGPRVGVDGLFDQRLEQVLRVARWPGVPLVPTQVFSAVVVPVVVYTGASERLARLQGPVLDLTTLEAWEEIPMEGTPASPLRIVGFVATARRWSRALSQATALAGLGPGMIFSGARTGSLPRMDADASGVWVVGVPPCEPEPVLWVTGRVGPIRTSTRVPETRLMEEALFQVALDTGCLS